MAMPGDVIENPVRGERIVFLKTARETGGQLLRIEVFVRPRSRGAGDDHTHPSSEERFTVLKGRIRVRVDGTERDVSEGQEAVVPAGTPHTFSNPFEEEAHLVVEVRPALRLETLAETDFGLVRDGHSTRKGDMKLLQAAVTLKEFAPEIRLPRWHLRWIIAVLAPVGRVLGYRPYYAKYGLPPSLD